MIQLGLIGTGYISEVHAQAAKEADNVSINSVFSRDKKKAESFADKYGIPNYYEDYSEFLNSNELDGVIICIPTPLHKEFALKALNAKKHVLCEKPIALSSNDAEEIKNSSEENGIIFMTAHVLRFWPEYVKAKEFIEEGTAGKIRSIYAYRLSEVPKWSDNNWLLDPKKSGGVPVDLQIHDIDFILWMLGDPLSVSAAGNKNTEGLIISSSVLMQYTEATAIAEAGYVMPERTGFEMGFKIITESAVIEYNNQRNPSMIIKKAGGTSEVINLPKRNAYSEQLEYFAQCVEANNHPERIKTADAIKSLKISLKVKLSIESHLNRSF